MELDKLEQLLILLQKYGVSEFAQAGLSIRIKPQVQAVPELPKSGAFVIPGIPEAALKGLPAEYSDPSLWSVNVG